jgi:ATP-dependent NAD(P)H-hydrate dehydratase
MEVSRAFGGVTILQKGAEDIIATNTGSASQEDAEKSKVDPQEESTEEQVVVDVPGGLKRCGGQGDILTGTVATALAWGKCFEDGAFGCVFLSPFLF